jgi:hypothetical protein
MNEKMKKGRKRKINLKYMVNKRGKNKDKKMYEGSRGTGVSHGEKIHVPTGKGKKLFSTIFMNLQHSLRTINRKKSISKMSYQNLPTCGNKGFYGLCDSNLLRKIVLERISYDQIQQIILPSHAVGISANANGRRCGGRDNEEIKYNRDKKVEKENGKKIYLNEKIQAKNVREEHIIAFC